jgi:hypothetical protein
LGYFCNKKPLAVNNRPIGENSPNLVTLTGGRNMENATTPFVIIIVITIVILG